MGATSPIMGMSIQKELGGPHNFMRSLKLCDVADVTKVAAYGTGRSGRVGKIGGWLRERDGLIPDVTLAMRCILYKGCK